MKTLIKILLPALFLAACSRPAKELGEVTIGMTKQEVLGIVGEPEKKDVINKTEVWDYPDSARTIVFRADTVYSVMTSPKARLDSVASWLDTTNQKVKKGFGNIGEKVEGAADKVRDRLKKDSTKTK